MDNYNKNIKLIFTAFICIIITTNMYAQKIKIYSISTSRQTNGDNGYTLDGHRMYGSRFKLLNPINFSSTGIYPKSISIIDAFETTNSLTQISKIVDDNIFFFGTFNKLDPSTQTFTNVEIDSLYKWSKRGGKLIIASGITFSFAYDGTMLNTKWGYSWNQKTQVFLFLLSLVTQHQFLMDLSEMYKMQIKALQLKGILQEFLLIQVSSQPIMMEILLFLWIVILWI